jgi:hypothetical protein
VDFLVVQMSSKVSFEGKLRRPEVGGVAQVCRHKKYDKEMVKEANKPT